MAGERRGEIFLRRDSRATRGRPRDRCTAGRSRPCRRVLCESTTMSSSAQATESSASPISAASFLRDDRDRHLRHAGSLTEGFAFAVFSFYVEGVTTRRTPQSVPAVRRAARRAFPSDLRPPQPRLPAVRARAPVPASTPRRWPRHRRTLPATWRPTVVLSPALGGVVIGQEVGRALGVRAIFAERQDGVLTLRRGFTLSPDRSRARRRRRADNGRIDARDDAGGESGRRPGRRRGVDRRSQRNGPAVRRAVCLRCSRCRCRPTSPRRARSARNRCRS